MRFLLTTVISILLLTTPLFGQSEKECFLFVVGNAGDKKALIDQIVRPMISSFVSPTKYEPPEGLKTSELNESCFFNVSVTMVGSSLNMSIESQRTPVKLSGESKSNRSFPDNVRHATLRILHKELSKPKKNEIYEKYSELLIDECPQNQRLIVIFVKESDRKRENVIKESRKNLVSGFESIVGSIDSVDLIGVSEIGIGDSIEDALARVMNEQGSNSSLLVMTEWEFQKQETSMWKGLVSMTVSIDSYSFKDGGLVNRGGYSIDPQRIPIRKWGKSSSFKKKNLQRITKKITSKWSEDEIEDFINSISK